MHSGRISNHSARYTNFRSLPLLALLAAFAAFSLTACSGKKTRQADCFDCVDQQQSWKKFSWSQLEGNWQGSLEKEENAQMAKGKSKKEVPAHLVVVNSEKFLASQGVKECAGLPTNSVVVLGQLWEVDPASTKVRKDERLFEVFAEQEDDRVAYGRAVVQQVNGGKLCTFQKINNRVSMNRLALPAVNFSRRMTSDGRVIASGKTMEYDVNVEFLNFVPKAASVPGMERDSRKPASVQLQDNPPLFIRVFKMSKNVTSPYSRGEWDKTEEYLYRLWRVN